MNRWIKSSKMGMSCYTCIKGGDEAEWEKKIGVGWQGLQRGEFSQSHNCEAS